MATPQQDPAPLIPLVDPRFGEYAAKGVAAFVDNMGEMIRVGQVEMERQARVAGKNLADAIVYLHQLGQRK
jgi:hypothetical protein